MLLINISAKNNQANFGGETYAPLAKLAIGPALSHRIYTLIGFAWPAFGVLFLTMLCSTDWFALSFPVHLLFPVVCLAALLLGHLTVMGLESRPVTAAFYYFRQGMPLIFYQRFAVVQRPAFESSITEGSVAGGSASMADGLGQAAIVFGARRILLSAVDQLHLTFLGVLEIRSYAASGKVLVPRGASDATAGTAIAGAVADATPDATLINRADLLARVPIGALTLRDQKRLVEVFREGRPGLIVNKRLDARLNSPIVKGQAVISSLGAVILLYALFDVGYATFTWLEMLKDYYGSQLCMRHPDKAQAFLGVSHAVRQPLERSPSENNQASAPKQLDKNAAVELYNRAEQLRTHPSKLSWAYRALFANGNSAAQLLAIRADTLYWIGRTDEAIEVLKQALRLKPTGYKIQLQLARMLAEHGSPDQAREVLNQVLEKHKDVLMPRVYNYALVGQDEKARGPLYKRYLAELDDEVFGDEPSWPPGGEKPLMEMWRRDDLEFLVPFFNFKRLPSSPPGGER